MLLFKDYFSNSMNHIKWGNEVEWPTVWDEKESNARWMEQGRKEGKNDGNGDE